MYRFDVRAGHSENVRGLINKRSGQWLAPQIADICSLVCADLYGVHARRLATNRMHPRGCDFDLLPVASQTAKEPFGDRAPANIACADEEDVFHGFERAASAFMKLEANMTKSISGLNKRRFAIDLALLATVHCG